jgi:hypothetical protein
MAGIFTGTTTALLLCLTHLKHYTALHTIQLEISVKLLIFQDI